MPRLTANEFVFARVSVSNTAPSANEVFVSWKDKLLHYNDDFHNSNSVTVGGKEAIGDDERVRLLDCYQVYVPSSTYTYTLPSSSGRGWASHTYNQGGYTLLIWFCWNVEFDAPQADVLVLDVGHGRSISSFRRFHSEETGTHWKYRRGHSPEYEKVIEQVFHDMWSGDLKPLTKVEYLTHPDKWLRGLGHRKFGEVDENKVDDP